MEAVNDDDIMLLRDVVEIEDKAGGISTFTFVASFADMEKVYPRTYRTLVRILVDWLATQMPATVKRYGQHRTLAWLMLMLEVDAARLQGQRLPTSTPDREQWQFRVIFDNIEASA